MFSTLRSGGAGAEIASRSGREVGAAGSGAAISGAGVAGSRVGCVGGSVGSGGSVGTVPSS